MEPKVVGGAEPGQQKFARAVESDAPVYRATMREGRAWGERETLWLAFALYVAAEVIGACRHEPWADELRVWNMARVSHTPLDLLRNIHYEGHPPVWHLILWVLSRFTRSVGGLHAGQLVAAVGVAALVLFAAPFRPVHRVLLLCGYYFLFEYGVLCRAYAVGVLLLFSLCIVQRQSLRARPFLYYGLLLGLASTHFLFLLLAVSLHVSVLWNEWRRGTLEPRAVIRHAAIGGSLVLLPFLFIQPPRDSQLSPSFWLSLWAPQNLFWVLIAPLRGIVPLPAWWRDHFWNTQALLELGKAHLWAKVAAVCISIFLVVAIFFAVPRRGAARLFLAVSFILCLATAVFFPLTSARYAGVLFIAFLAALWIADSPPRSRLSMGVFTSLLAVHASAGLFALQRDLRLPFSRSTEVVALASAIPPDGAIISDYNSLESVSAFLDRPVYSLQHARIASFANFDRRFDAHRSYADGLELFFTGTGAGEAFFFCPWPLDEARVFDAPFFSRFQAVSLGGYDGAIEPSSNLHLYRVMRRATEVRR